MDAEAGEHGRVGGGEVEVGLPILDAGAERDHAGDAVLQRVGDDGVGVIGELARREMAMGIGEQGGIGDWGLEIGDWRLVCAGYMVAREF